MSYSVDIIWEKKPGETFTDNRYSRSHRWVFDGGIEVAASASPHVVPLPFSNPNAVDPEEAFVAAISSCHMLWFLSIAAEKNLCVDSYTDHASGVLGKDRDGAGLLKSSLDGVLPLLLFLANWSSKACTRAASKSKLSLIWVNMAITASSPSWVAFRISASVGMLSVLIPFIVFLLVPFV